MNGANRNARSINIVLGAWLFLSAFSWQHTPAQFLNTWLVGLLTSAAALGGVWLPQLRYVNAALAGWLIVSVWALPTFTATGWHNFLIGLAAGILSFIPGESARHKQPARERPPPAMPAES